MRCLHLFFTICLLGGAAAAQNSAPPPVPFSYEVVAVKENHSGAYTSSLQFDRGNMLKANNANIMMMVCAAYDVPQYLVEGLPDWAMSEHFDVDGKILSASAEQLTVLTMEQRRAMLMTVLQDRFGLKAHWETTEKAEYALTVVKSGSKLKASQEQQPTNTRKWNSIDAKGIGLDDLTKDLQRVVNKPVVDKTGLMGKYDVKLSWSVDGQTLNGGEAKGDETQAGVFTALKETLGLELKPLRGPVQVLLVDAVTRPSPN